MTDHKTPLSDEVVKFPAEGYKVNAWVIFDDDLEQIRALEAKLAEAEKPWDNHKTFRDVAEQQIEKQTGYYPEDTVKGLQDVIERMEMVASTECWRIQEKLQVTERETRAETFEYVRQVWASKIAALEAKLAEAERLFRLANERKRFWHRGASRLRSRFDEKRYIWDEKARKLHEKLQVTERERDEWRHQARDTENALAEAQTEIDRLKQRNKELLNLIEDHEGYGESLRNQLSKK